jgi:quercetin dioxygenase-like cupin family protein
MDEPEGDEAERTVRALDVAGAHAGSDHGDDQEARRIADDLSLLGLTVPAVAPSRALRDRVLAAVGAATRFAGLADRVRELVDLPDERVRELLAAAADPSAHPWEAGPAAGIRLLRFITGPRRGHARGALVHCRPGAVFPEHRHLGDERALILEGTVLDSSGAEWSVGDVVRLPGGTRHSFAARPDHVAVSVVVAEGGIELTG